MIRWNMAMPTLSIISLLLGHLWLAGTDVPAPLRICEDAAEWAPFSFASADRPERLEGFTIDVLHALDLSPTTAKIDVLPWLRCLAEVERGERYQLSLSASVKPDRVGRYLYSEPYYSTHLHAFHDRRRFPAGLSLQTAADLSGYRVCGIFGYRYAGVTLDEGQLDQGAKSLRALFQRLDAGHCELVLSQIEVVEGYPHTGAGELMQPWIVHQPVPGVAPESYHMLISQQWSGGASLQQSINQSLARLRESGELARLRQRWGLQPGAETDVAAEPAVACGSDLASSQQSRDTR